MCIFRNLVTLDAKKRDFTKKMSKLSSNSYKNLQDIRTSTNKEYYMESIYDIKHHINTIKHDNRNSNKDTIRDINFSRHGNNRILNSTLFVDKGHGEKATWKKEKHIKNRIKENEDESKQITRPAHVITNDISDEYESTETETSGGNHALKYKRYSSDFTGSDANNLHLNNNIDKSNIHLLLSNETIQKRSPTNGLPNVKRGKRYANINVIPNRNRKAKYLKDINDDVIGSRFVEEGLLPFYRPTKYFLSPQLSMDGAEQSTVKDKSPSGNFRTSTLTINDIERDYFVSIASRSRRTTESASISSSFILNEPEDGSIDESDLSSSIMTSHRLGKSKRTTQTFHYDDKSIEEEGKTIYDKVNDRRTVLSLRSIDEQEDHRSKINADESDLLLMDIPFGNKKAPQKESSGTTSKDVSESPNIVSDEGIEIDYVPYETADANENSTFYGVSFGESGDLTNDTDGDESFATPNPIDYLDKTMSDDKIKQAKIKKISEILKIVEQQAQQGSNCTPGTGLNMEDIDLVGDNIKRFRGAAEVAVNRANWLTRMWKYASEIMQQSEYLLHSSLFSMIESNELIFGAGNCYDGWQYKNYSLFCPFAYKSPLVQGHILGKDLAVEYKYLKPDSTWFWTPKLHGAEMATSLVRFETGRIWYHLVIWSQINFAALVRHYCRMSRM